MFDRIIYRLKSVSPWHLLWMAVLLSEIFTLTVVVPLSLLFHGRITRDYLITGGITAFLVSLVVTYMTIYFTNVMREFENHAARFSETILNSMNEAVSVIDVKDFRILRCNAVFLKENGFTEEEVIGKTCYEIIYRRSSPCMQPDEPCPSRLTVETGEYAAAEHVHYAKDGEKKYVKVSTSPIKDNDGKVRQVIHVSADITETKRLYQELERLAATDKLTETYNRMKYEEIINRELERVRRYGQPLSLIMFDLDHFKEINDRYGHIAGDHTLKGIADIAKEHMRKIDYLFRWGGEEFMIVASETGIGQARSLAERIRKAIEDHSLKGVGKITASFGITQFQEGDTDDTLIKRVDTALYTAKISGRNCVEVII